MRPNACHGWFADILQEFPEFIVRLLVLPILAVAAVRQPVKARAPVQFDDAATQS